LVGFAEVLLAVHGFLAILCAWLACGLIERYPEVFTPDLPESTL